MQLNDQTKAALNKVVETSANALAQAIDGSVKLTKDNISELAREVIMFQGYINYGLSTFCSSLLISACYLTSSWVWLHESDHMREYWGVHVVAGIVAFIGICWWLDSVSSLLKARFARRMFLLEYAAQLLKKETK